jgi:GDPmannose 4,6-dehydratase
MRTELNANKPKRRALICGVSGQDGAYLSQLLLGKGYEVWGTSRDAQMSSFALLRELKIADQVKTISMSLTDFRSVLQAISKVQPDEIYNLAGQSSVGLSFDQPVDTFESITLGTINLLESIRFINPKIRFYNAGSSECFGDTGNETADENTAFRPTSPYAIAKAASTWQVSLYRKAYGLYATTGILFNHESPLRPERFVTKKIVAAVCRIANGSNEKLELGNIDIRRDWGWAPEYVDAMWRMLSLDAPEDFIIATGQTQSLKDFLRVAFETLNLDWQNHIVINEFLIRPSDPIEIKGQPSKALQYLAWEPNVKGSELVMQLVKSQMEKSTHNNKK